MPLVLRELPLLLLFVQIVVLQDVRLKEKVNIPARRHQMTQELQAWNRLLVLPRMILRRVSGLSEVCRNLWKQLQRCYKIILA